MSSTILVVEDNPTTRKLVRHTLKSRGYRVVEAADGATALALAVSEKPDLVLQDLLLPDTDGFDLVGHLRQRLARPGVPILAFSGLLSKGDEARISAVGFDDQIVKPCEPSRLLQIIQAHLPGPADADPERFGDGFRLIIADDDPVQSKLAAFRLGRVGFEVECASDGADALARARARPPDAIVSDVMMPVLDGFRLCMEARHDPRLSGVPIVLVTSSYIDQEDRRLAEQAGATAYVLRSPDFREVIEALQRTLRATHPPVPPRMAAPEDVEREHARRVIRQLERQVHLNTGVTQRCALLSAQLSILSGISNALTRREGMDEALDEALAACFDAGGISTGALCVLSLTGEPQIRSFGPTSWSSMLRQALWEEVEALRNSPPPERIVVLPRSPGSTDRPLAVALARLGVVSALLVPLLYREQLLGGLMLASDSVALLDEDRQAFGSGVASQLSQAIALARTFEEKQKTATTLQTVLDSLADGVAVVDKRGTSTYWNAAAERLVGLGTDSPVPLQLADRVSALPDEQHPLARALRGESTSRLEVYARRPASPEGRSLVASGTPLVDATGAPCGAVAVFRDVTEEKTAQEQLMMSDRMASIGLLAAGLAHEINNPLAASLGNLELAEMSLSRLDPSSSPDLAQLGEELSDALLASRRVAEIVRDLKLFARAKEDRPARVDILPALESALRLAWNEIRHRARLVKQLDPVEPVLANESRLGQVFLNLAVNAAQAIPEGRADQNEIRVSTRMDGQDRVIVEVSDTGSGIPPEVMTGLFTPFFTTKPPGVGTGLGLAISKRIIEGCGGEIQVQSTIGQGTTFRVLLPAMPSDLRQQAQDAASSPTPLSRRGRLLVIDDDPMILTVLRRVLDMHEVVATASPADALQYLQEGESFDLILCDLMMPYTTGMDLYESLQVDRPELLDRLVFMTGGAFSERARAFLDATAAPCLEKPFTAASLHAWVTRRLGRA